MLINNQKLVFLLYMKFVSVKFVFTLANTKMLIKDERKLLSWEMV